jgi:NADH:ubiquinone reductase (H+-translocating)
LKLWGKPRRRRDHKTDPSIAGRTGRALRDRGTDGSNALSNTSTLAAKRGDASRPSPNSSAGHGVEFARACAATRELEILMTLEFEDVYIPAGAAPMLREAAKAPKRPLAQTRPSATKKTRIVIVGGGAGGLQLATRLERHYGREHFDIVLVNRDRTHIWKPLLHEVAAGSLDANLEEVGYRDHCSRWGYRFVYGAMEGVDREARELVVAPLVDETGREVVARYRIPYDYLVLAIGSEANDFGTPGVREHCMLLDSRADADRFRNHLLNHFLRASRAASMPGEQFVRIAIVGAGATGVELAAELYNAAAALHHYGLESFDESCLKVTLIEAAPRILPALSETLSAAATVELEQLGVRVLTSTRVVAADAGGYTTSEGEHIGADIMLWVAGVKAPQILSEIGGLETNRSGQLVVRPTLQVTRDERVFAMGDCCTCVLPGAERPVPPRAQAADQMASAVADNLERMLRRKPLRDFVYRDYGSLVSLSRYSTVGNLMGNLVGGQLTVQGAIARLIYKSLYSKHLIGVHGCIKGAALIAVGAVNTIVRPRLKFH